MIRIFLWLIVFVAILVSPLFIYKGAQRIKDGGPRFKWRELFKETPVKESSGTILIIEGIFGFLCAGGMIFILLYRL